MFGAENSAETFVLLIFCLSPKISNLAKTEKQMSKQKMHFANAIKSMNREMETEPAS